MQSILRSHKESDRHIFALPIQFLGSLDTIRDGFEQFVYAIALGEYDGHGFGLLQLSEYFRLQFFQCFWFSHNRKSANKSVDSTAIAVSHFGVRPNSVQFPSAAASGHSCLGRTAAGLPPVLRFCVST